MPEEGQICECLYARTSHAFAAHKTGSGRRDAYRVNDSSRGSDSKVSSDCLEPGGGSEQPNGPQDSFPFLLSNEGLVVSAGM